MHAAKEGGRDFGVFQSAPLTEVRGDDEGAVHALAQQCFNPLPSPK